MNFIKTGRARIISILVLLLMLATLITMIPEAVEPIEVFAETVDYYELKAGDETVARFESESDAYKVIEDIKDNYVDETQDIVDVKITPAMTVEKVTVPKEEQPELQANTGVVLDVLLEGSQEQGAYVVQEGDTLWGIAEDNDMTLEELEQANPELNMEVIKVGDEINISETEYLVNVTVEYEVESEVAVPFETVYEDSPNLFVDEEPIVYIAGQDGSSKVTERIVEVNGVVSSREELASEVLAEPVTQVVVRGITERPVEETTATEETASVDNQETEATDNSGETSADQGQSETQESVASNEAESQSQTQTETETETVTATEDSTQTETAAEPVVEEPAPAEEPAVVEETTSSTSTSRESLVNYALQFCGNPYVWGGTSLTNGCDCSGFVYSVFNNCGYSIKRWPDDDYPHVSASELKPGDVVRYGGHYSIYIGNGMEVSALNVSRGICTHPMYYSRSAFMYGIRIIND